MQYSAHGLRDIPLNSSPFIITSDRGGYATHSHDPESGDRIYHILEAPEPEQERGCTTPFRDHTTRDRIYHVLEVPEQGRDRGCSREDRRQEVCTKAATQEIQGEYYLLGKET